MRASVSPAVSVSSALDVMHTIGLNVMNQEVVFVKIDKEQKETMVCPTCGQKIILEIHLSGHIETTQTYHWKPGDGVDEES